MAGRLLVTPRSEAAARIPLGACGARLPCPRRPSRELAVPLDRTNGGEYPEHDLAVRDRGDASADRSGPLGRLVMVSDLGQANRDEVVGGGIVTQERREFGARGGVALRAGEVV